MNAQVNLAAILALTMTVSKKAAVGDVAKFVPVGDVTYYCPTLAAFGINAEPQAKDGAPVLEDGLPVYAADELNWLQKAIHQQVKAQARNKLVSGTTDLKDGQTIATTLAELCAESEGSTAALEAIRAVKAIWAKWVAASGKSAATQNLLVTLFGNKQALASQPEGTKTKFANYIADFAVTLDDYELASAQRYLDSLIAVTSATIAADDF